MKRRNLAALVAAATALAVVPVAGTASAADGKTVLKNSGVQRNLAGHKLTLGGAAPSQTTMQLTLQLPLRNEAKAMQLMAKGTTLTPAQFDAQFGANKAQLAKVAKWAKSQGLSVTQTSAGTGMVVVEGKIAKVDKALGVKMRTATLDGRKGLAVDRDPVVPSSLGLSGIGGLNKLAPAHKNNAKSPVAPFNSVRDVQIGGARKHANGDGNYGCVRYWGEHLGSVSKKYANESNAPCGYQPAQLQSVYGAKAYAGKAPVLGILLWGNDTSTLTNTNAYMAQVGFPQLASAKYKTFIDTPNASMNNCDRDPAEQNMDVQSSHAIAPAATIHYYSGASCFGSDMTAALVKMVDRHQVSTISMSFGFADEVGWTSTDMVAWDRPFMKAGLTGISTFASSGDDNDGSKISSNKKPAVGYPASSAYTTAVGGTSVGINAAGAPAVTTAWENSYYVQASTTSTSWTNVTSQVGYKGGGGGVSTISAQPTWQKGVVGSYTKRAVPDVSAIANPDTGFLVRYAGSDGVAYYPTGGTSLASPVVAALVGLAKVNNNVKIGNAAPYFYKLRSTSAIKDVNGKGSAGAVYKTTQGQIVVIGFDDKPLTLASGPGWDNATGVGTPNGAAFITSFK